MQAVLAKASGLAINLICPLHGPVWRKDLAWYLKYYDLWSRYEPEERGVAVFYGTIHGHTANAAEILAAAISQGGALVKVFDVSKTELSELLAEAFRYSHLVFACATQNNGIFLNMEHLLCDLRAHGFRNRSYAIVENGSWSPQAGTLMEAEIAQWKGMKQLGSKVTVLSSVKQEQAAELWELGRILAEDVSGSRTEIENK